MYSTDGKNITVPRGDTASIAFTLLEADGETPYILSGGQYARFDVYRTSVSAPEITKTVPAESQSEDGTVVFELTAEDTDRERHGYLYTVKLMNDDGTCTDTVCGSPGKAFFEIR